MPYRVAVVDDDEKALCVICALLEMGFQREGAACSIHPFHSTMEVENEGFDAYFLDIDMPHLDGIQFALSVRATGSMSCIVFISGMESCVFDAMRAQPLRFIRKSRLENEIGEAVHAVVSQWQRFGSDTLLVTSAYQSILIPVNRILYIESFGNHQHIVTLEETHVIYQSLDYFEKQLKERGFYRIQRSYLVNMSAVICVDHSQAVLCNGVRLPISRFKVDETRQQLTRRFFS